MQKEMNIGYVVLTHSVLFILDVLNDQFEIHFPGDPGHGSRFVQNTAAEKARYMINKMLDYREVQRKRLEDNPNLSLGDVNTVNLTMMNGGMQANVVPDQLVITFDVRITPTSSLQGKSININLLYNSP